MRVLIAGTNFSFPYGQGATARVHAYAKALRSAGAEVLVASLLLPFPGQSDGDESVAGMYDGTRYEYACGTRVRRATFFGRRTLSARMLLRTWRLIASMSRGAPGRSAVLIYSGSWVWIAILSAMARLNGAVAVLDLCEYPLVGRLGSAGAAAQRAVLRHVVYPSLDGILPVSTYLDEYARGSVRPPALLLVPVMVDTEAFKPGPGGDGPPVLLYCGALGRHDEVARAVRAFSAATRHLPDARLLVVGEGPPDKVARAQGLVEELGVGERVRFTGAVGGEQLPALFGQATVFLLPRPAGRFSMAGLPNKLGEYLAAGCAVIATSTGDIGRYLRDGVDAYLADPDDQDAFAERLRHALDHPDEAAAVGARGREVALREFDLRRHGERLVAFLDRLGRGGPR